MCSMLVVGGTRAAPEFTCAREQGTQRLVPVEGKRATGQVAPPALPKQVASQSSKMAVPQPVILAPGAAVAFQVAAS